MCSWFSVPDLCSQCDRAAIEIEHHFAQNTAHTHGGYHSFRAYDGDDVILISVAEGTRRRFRS